MTLSMSSYSPCSCLQRAIAPSSLTRDASRSSAFRGERARFPAPPEGAPDPDHDRWIRQSPARSAWPACSASRTCCSRMRRWSRYAVSTAIGSSIAAPWAGSRRRGSSARSRSSDAQVFAEIAAAAPVNHHAAAEDDEIAGENRPRRLVPEREVIRRVPRRVQRDERLVADRNNLAIGKRPPRDSVPVVLFRPGILREPSVRMRCPDRRRA